MSTTKVWNELHHPLIQDGYLISPLGDIRFKYVDEDQSYRARYHSTNGYDFAEFILKPEYQKKNAISSLFPIDEILAMVYIPVPESLQGKPVRVNHVNGDTRDVSLINLEWVEDVEEWRDVTYPDVTPGKYQVSNHGHVRQGDFVYSDRHHNDRGYNTLSFTAVSRPTVQIATHRVVAHAFCEKINDDETDVNHINGNKECNKAKNLEWVTHRDNMIHAFDLNMIGKRHGTDSTCSKT